MSGKKARRLRNILRHLTNKATIPVAICGLTFIPMRADADVIFSVFPHYMRPLPVGESHEIQGAAGAGARLTYRPNEYMNFYLQGDYLALSLPNVDSIKVLNGAFGAGYRIPLGDRLSFNMNMSIGSYYATYKDNMTSISGEFSLSLEYKLNPIVSAEVNTSLAHYNAGDTNLITGAQISPGISLNITQAFGRNAKVKIEQKRMDPVFPVLYSWYENNSFGAVTIENKEDASITNVSVKFFQPQYMSQPNECASIQTLKKGESADVELTAFFNERMLDLLEMTDTQATITVDYEILGMKKTSTIALSVPVCGRNSMSWDDDRRAAVFVSSKDPAAMWYSKLVSSVVRNELRNGVPENIQYAMGIFDTLDEFGINYVIDPTSSYADNVGTTSIDFLQFPYQTLMYRGGDCDDLSILISSLFEAVGIPTAFITIPGHIFMAFDSGVAYEETKYIFSENDYFINHDGEAWIPVEITLTDEGFSKAWRTGAREWRTADAMGTAAFYATHDSWKLYKPVSVPGAAIKFTMVDEDSIAKIYKHSIDDWIAREISDQVDTYLAKIESEGRVEDINALGVLYGRYGLCDKAEGQLKVARRQKYLPAILNTANVYYSMKEFALARQWYEYYLESDPENALALLGISKCSYELEDYKKCDEAFEKVIEKAPTLASNNTYLGAFENTAGRAFSLAQRLSNTVWIRTEDELSLYKANPNNEEEKKNDNFLWEDSVQIALVFPEDGEDDFDEDFEDGKPNAKKNKPKDEQKDEPKVALNNEEDEDSEIADIPGFAEPAEKSERENGLAIADLDINAEEIDEEEFEVDRIVGLEKQIAIPDTTFILTELGLEKKEIAVADEPEKQAVQQPKKKQTIEVTVETEKTVPTVQDNSQKQTPAKNTESQKNKIEVTIENEQTQIATQPEEIQKTEIAITNEQTQVETQQKETQKSVIETQNEQTQIVTQPEETQKTEIAIANEKTQIVTQPEIAQKNKVETASEKVQIATQPEATQESEVETQNKQAQIATQPEETQKSVIAISNEEAQIETQQNVTQKSVIETPNAQVQIATQPEVTQKSVIETQNEQAQIATQPVITPKSVIETQNEQVQIAEQPEVTQKAQIEITIEKEQVAVADDGEDDGEIIETGDVDSEEIAIADEEVKNVEQPETEEIQQTQIAIADEENPEDMSEVFDLIWDDEKSSAKTEAADMSDIFDEIWDKKSTPATTKISEFEKREKMARSGGIENVDEKQLKDVKYDDKSAEENEEPQAIVTFREVPRYSETATSKWATKESYEQDFIPGMKSYEEELGLSDERQKWKTDNNSFLRAPDNDVEVIEKPKEEKTVAAEIISFLDSEKEEETQSDSKDVLEEILSGNSSEKQKAQPAEKHAKNAKSATETAHEKDNGSENAKESVEEKEANVEEKDEENEEVLVETTDGNEIRSENSENAAEKRAAENASKKTVNKKVNEEPEIQTVSEKSEKIGKAESNGTNQDEEKNDHHWLLWAFLGCGIIGFFVFFLLFWKRDDDEEDEEGKKKQKVSDEESK